MLPAGDPWLPLEASLDIEARAASIQVLDTDATVWVSSVDGKPIATGRRLLVTHLADLQNSDTRYGDRSRQVLLPWGRLPHLVRGGRAVVALRVAHASRATRSVRRLPQSATLKWPRPDCYRPAAHQMERATNCW
ncbi:MAG: hypothetical protein JXQ71_17805 [Verrucomicrobia bacterium]|nr:hypothetical protein [Verrucomicrobiota bacterium]